MRLVCTLVSYIADLWPPAPDATPTPTDGHESERPRAAMHFCSFCRKRSSVQARQATKNGRKERRKERRVSRPRRTYVPADNSGEAHCTAPHAYLVFGRNVMHAERLPFPPFVPSLSAAAVFSWACAAHRAAAPPRRKLFSSLARLFALARQRQVGRSRAAGRSLPSPNSILFSLLFFSSPATLFILFFTLALRSAIILHCIDRTSGGVGLVVL